MKELEKLLEGMTEADRRAVLAKYAAVFDESEDEQLTVSRLGSPTKAAVQELRGYTPSPEPEAAAESAEEPQPCDSVPEADSAAEEPAAEEPAAEDTGPAPAEDGQAEETEPETAAPDTEESAPAEETETAEDTAPSEPGGEPDAQEEAAAETGAGETAETAAQEQLSRQDEPEAETSAPPLSAGRLVLFILFGIVVCVPAALLLTLVSVAVFGAGVGILLGGAFIISLSFLGVAIFADIMMLCSIGIMTAAAALIVIFTGIWFFISVVIGFINLILRTGRRWCRPEEEAAE